MTKVLLIVEDDPSMLKLYHDAFSMHGYQVEDAEDGVKGLKKASEIVPKIIILDLMMPKMDGIEVLELLKANDKTKDIPVIILTNIARDSLGLTEEALAKGAVKYVVKSDHDPDEIVEIVERVLKVDSEEVASKHQTQEKKN